MNLKYPKDVHIFESKNPLKSVHNEVWISINLEFIQRFLSSKNVR
jgi:hypothetical protein